MITTRNSRLSTAHAKFNCTLTLALTILCLLVPGFAGAIGTWSPLVHTAPGSVGHLHLLSDGTVMVENNNDNSVFGPAWFLLTPDSSGHYANGTWTTLSSMHDTRLFFPTQLLKDGRLFAAGGEYGTGTNTGEIYNPLLNTWTQLPVSGHRFSDANSEILPDGRVLIALVEGNLRNTLIYNPTNNTWIAGPACNGINNESAWVKLPDDSILMVDRLSTSSERYIPSLNQWVVDATVPVALYDSFGDETGPGMLLPNGKVILFGATGHNAIYTPSGTSAPGTWSAAPDFPNGQGMPDAPSAMLPNGKILVATAPIPISGNVFQSPTSFYEYDYVANSYTQVNAPAGGLTENGSSFQRNMLLLPDGTVLSSRFTTQLYIYTPDGTPLAAGKPTISSITQNLDGSFHLIGTQLNGISEGACYGDDDQNSSNYPLVRVTNGSGNVFYARTFNWSSTSVMTSNLLVSTEFTMPTNATGGNFSLVVVANGISSDPVGFLPAQPAISISDASVLEGDSGLTNMAFTVSVTPTPTNTISVNYFTTNGSATAGSDYFATNGTLVFLPGETNKTIFVQIIGDTLPETDETFFVNLFSPTNASVTDSSGTGLILNDDAPPSISIASVTVTEGNSGTTNAVFAVTLSTPSGATVTVSYATQNGTALAGSDFISTNGVVSFPPGITSTSVTVRVIGDLAVEADETFSVNLSAPVNATLLVSNAVGTILNDDGLPGNVDHFSWSAISSPQYVSQPFGVVLSALDFSNNPATNFNGTANLSANTLGGVTIFQANFESGMQGFTVDNTVGNSNGLWHLSTGRGANAGHSSSSSLYYGMGEGPSGGGNYDISTSEGAVISPAISLVGAVAPVTLQFNYLLQTEGNPNFDAAIVEISTNNGASYSTLANANLGGALTNNTFGLWLPASLNLSSFVGQQIRIRFHFNSVDGGANAFEGWYVDDVIVTSTQPNPAITPTITGAFTNGTWAGTIAVLQSTANIFLRANDNNGHTGDSGTFDVLSANDVSLTASGAPNPVRVGATLTYLLTVANSGPSVATGILLTNILPSSVTNPIVTPSQGTFSINGNTITCDLGAINSGATATVSITVNPQVAGSITNQATVYRTGADGDPSNNSVAVVTIVTVPSLVISNASLTEGNAGTANMSFGVTLSDIPALPVTVQYATANLTATAGVDYLATNGVLTFLVGETNKTILVPVVGDTLFESNETFQVTLSNPINATLATAAATGTILNDDNPPTVSIGNVIVVEGNTGTTDAVFVVTLTPASGAPASVTFATTANTATSGVDFAPTNGVLTIPAGITSTSIVVKVLGDTLNESNETFFVNLSAPVNATLGVSQGIGTILDDDILPTIAAAGFTVLADYCNSNGVVDAGELVTLGFALRNTGATAMASNLVATLLAAPDVFAPSGPQLYGPLLPGATKTNLFTFRANAMCGATINPTLQLQDGANDLGVAIFPIALSAGASSNIFTFTNSANITIPDSGTGTPYPSVINVSNVVGTVAKVTAKLKSMSHTFLNDVDVLFVGPGGQKVMLKGSGGGGNPGVSGAIFTFDSAAATAFPSGSIPASGNYRPANYDASTFSLPSPAPVAPYVTNLLVFNSVNPNGAWQLFVNDHAAGDSGNIAAGWELALTVVTTGSCCQSPLEFVGPVVYTNGTIRLSAFVTPGQNYQIQASTNLFIWTPVSNVFSTSSPVLFVDPAASNFPARFYRGLSQ